MASEKVTISIQKSLYKILKTIADDMELPSSVMLELAIDQFAQKYQKNRELLQKINAAYDDLPDTEEQTFLIKMKTHHKNLVEEEC